MKKVIITCNICGKTIFTGSEGGINVKVSRISLKKGIFFPCEYERNGSYHFCENCMESIAKCAVEMRGEMGKNG